MQSARASEVQRVTGVGAEPCQVGGHAAAAARRLEATVDNHAPRLDDANVAGDREIPNARIVGPERRPARHLEGDAATKEASDEGMTSPLSVALLACELVVDVLVLELRHVGGLGARR